MMLKRPIPIPFQKYLFMFYRGKYLIRQPPLGDFNAEWRKQAAWHIFELLGMSRWANAISHTEKMHAQMSAEYLRDICAQGPHFQKLAETQFKNERMAVERVLAGVSSPE